MLTPIRVSLDGCGFVKAYSSEAGLLPDLAAVPAHYDHVITSIGSAGRDFTALRAQVAKINLEVDRLTPLLAQLEESRTVADGLRNELATENHQLTADNVQVTTLTAERDTANQQLTAAKVQVTTLTAK